MTKSPLQYTEEAHELAAKLGGKCLSEYSYHYVKMLWKCKQGHEFTCHLYNVRRGTWCVACKRRRITIEDCRKIAKERGGECLSKVYVATENLEWKCDKGHTWFANWNNVSGKKSWCPTCWDKKRDPHEKEWFKNTCVKKLEECQRIAQERGGECLSEEYRNGTDKMLWKCKNGHIWNAAYKAVCMDRYTWCPYCLHKNEQKCREIFEELLGVKMPKKRSLFSNSFLELDGYTDCAGPNRDVKIGFEYQGEQHFMEVPRFSTHSLDEQYIRDQQKRDECKELGIHLIEIPYTVKNKEEFIQEKIALVWNSIEHQKIVHKPIEEIKYTTKSGLKITRKRYV
jgi:hypothetical protein